MNFPKANGSAFQRKCRSFFKKYKHSLLLLYFVFYLLWFGFLEKNITRHFHVIHMSIDDKIPFIEYFIVPYLLWFVYIAAAILYFLFTNKDEYYRLCSFLFIGMTIFLIVSTVYPNGHYLRPQTFERANIFVDLVRALYRTDTATNLFPSIHVYNSIGTNIAVWHCENFREHKFIRFGSALLSICIILSTLFLKQHSVFDVITGIILSVFTYTIVYSKGRLRVNATNPSLDQTIKEI